MWRIAVVTPYRSFTFWVHKDPKWAKGLQDKALYLSLNGFEPKTITYEKNPDSGFYKIYAYNRSADEIPDAH